MKLEITSKGMDLTPAIKNSIEKALQKSLKITKGLSSEEHFKVFVEKTNSPEEPFLAKIVTHIFKKDLVVTKSGKDLYAVLDLISDDLARHLRKEKEKHYV